MRIDRHLEQPLYRQIYNEILDQIRRGELLPLEALPPTRHLAKQLGVSRNVVLSAYELLAAEGYIESVPGSYTRISKKIRDIPKREAPVEMSKPSETKAYEISFRTGMVDTEQFPAKVWGKYLREACLTMNDNAFGYLDSGGLSDLKIQIAKELYKSRGMAVDAQSIVVTSGATQGLSLVGRALHEHNCEAIIEDPCSLGARKTLEYAGYTLIGAKVDDEGLDVSSVLPNNRTKLIYTTPSHQFPKGSVLSASRRLDLLNRAKEAGVYIIEDDYDSEFRYDGHPLTPMRVLDSENVIYIGSFSKILSPALRIGYVIAPKHLIKRIKAFKLYDDVHTGTIEQAALAQFIEDGRLSRHIHKMNRLYKKKRDVW